MTPHDLVQTLGTYGGAFAVGAISSLIPFVSIDLFLIGLTVATGTSLAVALPVVLLASAGQLAGKLPIYWASRGAANLPDRHRERLERMRARITRWQNAPHLILAVSALVGLPPFSLMATAAGILEIRLRSFCVVVFAGRAARFAIVIAVTALASR
ncbi:MAG TPA: VTT domain-containing protein [Kofleriaceae bacterium]|jgi:membrane protein YqaA with SNARE-associated domain|nr:VTT domain-containing protein [Kofleriaceae bacterium]